MQPPFDVMMSAPTYGNLEPHNLYFPGIGWQKNVVFTKCHTNSVLTSVGLAKSFFFEFVFGKEIVLIFVVFENTEKRKEIKSS